MKLYLIVESYSGDILDHSMSITLNQEGATLGRRDDNTLVLQDVRKFVSNHHAVIEYKHPDYYITDISTNGVFINQTKMSKGQDNSVKLSDGDVLNLGDYAISVKMTEENLEHSELQPTPSLAEESVLSEEQIDEPNSAQPLEAPLQNEPFPSPYEQKNNPEIAESPPDLQIDEMIESPINEKDNSEKDNVTPQSTLEERQSLDEDISLDSISQNRSGNQSVINSDDHLSENNKTEDDAYAPPSPPLEKETEPAQTDEAAEHAQNAQSLPVPEPSDDFSSKLKDLATSEFQSELIQSFLNGAQLDGDKFAQAIDSKTFYVIGKILRASIQGSMDVLSGRAKIKNEMHLDLTMIRPRQNNPLKFSISADEALMKLLSFQNTGYLPPEEAIKEAFDDIKTHQYSVIAGMQTALQSVLQRFDPQNLEQRLRKQSPLSAKIPLHKQAKLWILFKCLYEEIEHEAEDNFFHLFGKAFAETYEQQNRKLKNSQKDIPIK